MSEPENGVEMLLHGSELQVTCGGALCCLMICVV